MQQAIPNPQPPARFQILLRIRKFLALSAALVAEVIALASMIVALATGLYLLGVLVNY
jgi:hypothetical protein